MLRRSLQAFIAGLEHLGIIVREQTPEERMQIIRRSEHKTYVRDAENRKVRLMFSQTS